MIPVLYFRSSSLNNWYYCQNQFFINYVLGHEKKSTLKTTKGTAVHKVLELLAEIKKRFQDSDASTITFHDEAIGEILVDRRSWIDPYLLANQEVEMINRSRTNKYNYLIPCQLPYGYIRYGVPLVNTLVSRVVQYYDGTFGDVFKPVDIKDIDNWVWMTLEYKNGMIDPRRRKIVSPEIHFDFPLEYDWAKYEYGEISGNLRLKGTIDLVVDEGNGILEIIDWKTSALTDWNSKNAEEYKTYKKICDDTQLMLYYYAAHKLFPEAKQIMVTIMFIRSGGPYTICFDESHLRKIEDRIRDKFHEIRSTQLPTMVDHSQNSFKCTRLCDYYKASSPCGTTNFCRFIHEKIKSDGIEKVVAEHSKHGFELGKYSAPGEIKE